MKPAARARVAVVTLGCAKNLADTDLLAGQLLRQGLEITGDPGDADAIIVNTCAFLTSSQQESVDTILEMAEHKRGNRRRRLVVVGCLAQRHGASLLDAIPEIDLVVGPGEVHGLAPRLRSWMEEDGIAQADRVHLGGMETVEERWDIRVVSNLRHTAYV
jgi:tRNA A37 methylthiotransferase MiaB